jgi:hypothetical protein
MDLIQNKNSLACMVTESYEEWDILIQKLKERNSQHYNRDEESESSNYNQQFPIYKIIHKCPSEDPDV